MPVRPLDQTILKWPSRSAVLEALQEWAATVKDRYDGVVAIGYFGSYARKEEGVGSDLDAVIVTNKSPEPFEKRSLQFDFPDLPVPVDLLVYTEDEWRQKATTGMRRVADEVVWLFKEVSPS